MILEVGQLTTIAEYFVICSGGSQRQVRAVAETIKEGFARQGIYPLGIEGMEQSSWILMDYSDILVHIFKEDMRSFYKLERLWGDAPRVTPKAGHRS